MSEVHVSRAGVHDCAALVRGSSGTRTRTGAKGLLVEIPFSEPKLLGLYESAGYRKDAVFDVYRLGVAAPA